MNDRLSREAFDRFTRHTALPVYGWLLAYWRGYAWLFCHECAWFCVSATDDLAVLHADHLIAAPNAHLPVPSR